MQVQKFLVFLRGNSKMKFEKGEKHLKYKHGFSGSRLYKKWALMKQRILNPKRDNYKYYGGRGITICNEWLEFIPFRDWSLSNGYQEGLEIDRRNNNGNYEPNNCRWISSVENIRKQKQVKITLGIANEIRDLWNTGNYIQQELADKYNLHRSTISLIINNKSWKN